MNRNSIYQDDNFLTIEVPHQMPVIAKSYSGESVAFSEESDAMRERFDDLGVDWQPASWDEIHDRVSSDCHTFLTLDRTDAAEMRRRISDPAAQSRPHQWVEILAALNEFLEGEEN